MSHSDAEAISQVIVCEEVQLAREIVRRTDGDVPYGGEEHAGHDIDSEVGDTSLAVTEEGVRRELLGHSWEGEPQVAQSPAWLRGQEQVTDSAISRIGGPLVLALDVEFADP